jgi:3-hydroxyisobutyrate dehydrogenase-like beta-hydroxyacid dehydrogenase
MVDRLVAAGHEVTVLGRSAQGREALRAAGARPVPDVTAVAGQADIVCVCVFSDEQVREVALGVASSAESGTNAVPRVRIVDAMPEGATLVIHTTGSPRTARAIAELDV